jgi:transcriptional regulator with XRE-family HTH domain
VSAVLDVEALRNRLDEERQRRGLSWRQVAKQAGVSPSALARLRHGKRPDVDGYGSLMQWLTGQAGPFFATVAAADVDPLAALVGIADDAPDDGRPWDVDAVVYGP